MEFEICCMTITLASLMIADLAQTSQFTKEGIFVERNPIAEPFVKYSNSQGEIFLGTLGLSVLFLTYNKGDPKINTYIKTLWFVGHTIAIYHNYKDNNLSLTPILLPVMTINF